jgi:hypothetical protein
MIRTFIGGWTELVSEYNFRGYRQGSVGSGLVPAIDWVSLSMKWYEPVN